MIRLPWFYPGTRYSYSSVSLTERIFRVKEKYYILTPCSFANTISYRSCICSLQSFISLTYRFYYIVNFSPVILLLHLHMFVDLNLYYNLWLHSGLVGSKETCEFSALSESSLLWFSPGDEFEAVLLSESFSR